MPRAINALFSSTNPKADDDPVVAATAPGKVVLLGEYAVLEGAPALVMAVDRLVRVELRRDEAGGRTPGGATPSARVAGLHIREGGRIVPDDGAGHEGVELAASVLDALVERCGPVDPGLYGLDVRLDSRALFYQDRTGRSVKLGLGSSAALTVALARALAACMGLPEMSRERWLPLLVDAHRRFQRGHGSGLDVAASLCGGVIEYRLARCRPRAVSRMLPAGLSMRVVWTGAAASTQRLLVQLNTWRRRCPLDYNSIMDDLSAASRAGAEAVDRGDGAEFVQAASRFSGILSEMDARAGLDILASGHRDLEAMAIGSGLVYKPCGAGGGDLGIAMGMDPDKTERFSSLVRGAGYQVLEMSVHPDGVMISRTQ